MSKSQRLACGLHPPLGPHGPFAAVQAAWRFYANPRIHLPQLAQPLICCARQAAITACKDWLLNVLDWSLLHYNGHTSKGDRVPLGCKNDLGYDLLTSLVLGDGDGRPLAPVCLEVRAADGVHSTRDRVPRAAGSRLDDLAEVVEHVESLNLGRPLVHILDPEADSVSLYRQWQLNDRYFLVRADDNRQVLHEGRPCKLGDLATQLRREGRLVKVRQVTYKRQAAWQWLAQVQVVLNRPACQHRVIGGKARQVVISGPPVTLRLVVSEIRNAKGEVLARWLLLSNLPASVDPATIALWYYWRWRIESYHKLLKSAGHHVEQWQQETGQAVARRLAIVAMSAVVVWHLARDKRPAAQELRKVLIRLSGRQMKRGPHMPGFTEPALLAGLGILVVLLAASEHYDLPKLQGLVGSTLPDVLPSVRRESG